MNHGLETNQAVQIVSLPFRYTPYVNDVIYARRGKSANLVSRSHPKKLQQVPCTDISLNIRSSVDGSSSEGSQGV